MKKEVERKKPKKYYYEYKRSLTKRKHDHVKSF